MLKAYLLIAISAVTILPGQAQVKKQFTVEKMEGCDRVSLHLKAKTGNCFIRPGQNKEILTIYSNQDAEEYSHSFSNEMKGTTCQVKLALEQEIHRGVGRKLSYHVFGNEERPQEKFWKVYLSELTPYQLELDYGLGNANVDLSGLSISKLKINTGSADVNIGYSTGEENRMEMDTFYVKVDLGSLNARQLNLSNSKVYVADVGFGNMLLDFSNHSSTGHFIKGTVGAGNLVIHLPESSVPVIVKISDSWLCSISLSHSLKKIDQNTFANAAYSTNKKGALVFDLDVSLGKIIFKEH
jgi:hypothetical protein